jgi:hypothetical protein
MHILERKAGLPTKPAEAEVEMNRRAKVVAAGALLTTDYQFS